MIHRGRNGEERWRTEKLSFSLLPPPHTRFEFLGAHAGARFESSSVVAVFATRPEELVVGGARGGGRGLANFFCSPLPRAKLTKLGRREAQRGEKEEKGLFMLRQKCLQHSPAKKEAATLDRSLKHA